MKGLQVRIIHLGGENTVTGSCHLLRARGLNILVDCGTAQGDDPVVPMEKWPVRPAKIDFLFLTHAHIDHTGRVPELIQRGFRGEILATGERPGEQEKRSPVCGLTGPGNTGERYPHVFKEARRVCDPGRRQD